MFIRTNMRILVHCRRLCHRNTANWNRAWQYFASYAGLQALFIVNNDIMVSDGTFSKLHRCAMHLPVPGECGWGQIVRLGSWPVSAGRRHSVVRACTAVM